MNEQEMRNYMKDRMNEELNQDYLLRNRNSKLTRVEKSIQDYKDLKNNVAIAIGSLGLLALLFTSGCATNPQRPEPIGWQQRELRRLEDNYNRNKIEAPIIYFNK